MSDSSSSAAADAPGRGAQHRRWRAWQVLLLFGGGLVLGLGLAWIGADAQARRQLAAVQQKFATAGFPTRLEQIIPAALPAGEDADDALRDAWMLLPGGGRDLSASADAIFAPVDKLWRAQRAATDGSIRFSAEVLAQLHALVQAPEFAAFERAMWSATAKTGWKLPEAEYRRGIRFEGIDWRPVRSSVILLTSAAIAHAAVDGEAELAWRNLAAAHTLADWVGEQPLLLSAMTSQLCRRHVSAALVSVLESAGPPESFRPLIEQHLRSAASAVGEPLRAMHSERLLFLDSLREIHVENRGNWVRDLGGLGGFPALVSWMRPWLSPVASSIGRPHLIQDMAECYDIQLDVASALASPGRAMTERLRHADERVSGTKSTLAQMLMPAITTFAHGHQADLARQHAMIVLLAAWRHRLETELWPTRVTELGLPAEVTVDPYSRRPITLRIEEDMITAWATGLDGDDDGGRDAERPGAPDGDGDIAVRIRVRPEFLW